jgi:hypothetical protein
MPQMVPQPQEKGTLIFFARQDFDAALKAHARSRSGVRQDSSQFFGNYRAWFIVDASARLIDGRRWQGS